MNNIGNYIKITKRNAHPNLQPQAVKEGDILRVVETRGDKLLVTHELKHNVRGKVYTINPKRFEWKAYTDVKCLVQDLTSIESERIIQRMTTELTEEQIVKVAIVPLIIESVAWIYCQAARDKAAQERVEITKKLSRTFIDTERLGDLRTTPDTESSGSQREYKCGSWENEPIGRDCQEIQACWENFPTQPPICSRDDGLSCRLDGITFPKLRSKSIEGYGNAVVPQVVYEIFKAIEQVENEHRHIKMQQQRLPTQEDL